MDTSEVSRSGSAARRHGRNISYGNRTPLPRRSTKGPLDIEDPLAISSSSTSSIPPASPSKIDAASPTSTHPAPATTTSRPTNLTPKPSLPSRPRSRSPRPPSLKDFIFLRRPENFHALPPQDPILPTPSQLPPDNPLPTLLAQYQYRSAATSAITTLTSPSHLPPPEIFNLWYVRLACLILTTHTPLAAQESLVLGDIHSAYYIDDDTGECILPWELRVLAVRLQNLGTRAQVQGYYDLAAYARRRLTATPGKYQNVSNDNTAEARKLWKDRLKDLSYRITNSLIETGDLAAASRHLESLHHHASTTTTITTTQSKTTTTTRIKEAATTEQKMLTTWLVLLTLKMGDLPAAKHWIHSTLPTPTTSSPSTAPPETTPHPSSHNTEPNILTPLLSMAESRYEDAQNLSTSLLYTGLLPSAREILEDLLFPDRPLPDFRGGGKGERERGSGNRAAVFNLATLYELCGEQARERKLELAGKIISTAENKKGGMELCKADFKL
ncbi:MAG: hypothetical protein LQ350_008427 [Teloschistes chrysophthalmus]|nr:MAG: hypothetical protein LQ350_008427 [Niorma chrysophthalma]